MHQCLGNWVAIGRVVLYYVRAVEAISAGIKWLHCMSGNMIFMLSLVSCTWVIPGSKGESHLPVNGPRLHSFSRSFTR